MAMTEDLLLEDIIFTTGLDAEIKNDKFEIKAEVEEDSFDFYDRFDMDFGTDDFGF
ncbi:MAG: hypothetical protein AAF557_11685 [Pseudomonadota bacterium]